MGRPGLRRRRTVTAARSSAGTPGSTAAHVTGRRLGPGRSQIGGHALICGTAVDRRAAADRRDVVIGDGADITCAADYETHRLSWGETVTLYRCDDGASASAATRKCTAPSPLGRTHLPDTRLSARVSELMELWSTASESLADD